MYYSRPMTDITTLLHETNDVKLRTEVEIFGGRGIRLVQSLVLCHSETTNIADAHTTVWVKPDSDNHGRLK